MVIFSDSYNFIPWYKDAMSKAGIDSINATFIDSSLLKLSSKHAVITIPDLDIPGIIAKA